MKKIDTVVANHFDTIYSAKPKIKYNFNPRGMGAKDRKIIQCLLRHGIEGKRCLDIGPGTGRWLTFLRNNGAGYLSAIDISQESLNRCSRLCEKTQKADVGEDRFNFEQDFFDIIISFEVLEHLRDPRNYLSEMIRVIKNDGMIMMSTPNIVSLISRMRMLFGLLPLAILTDKTHISFYRQREIVKLLSAYGQKPFFVPTSISLNPLDAKSRFRIHSTGLMSSFDDSLLFLIKVKK